MKAQSKMKVYFLFTLLAVLCRPYTIEATQEELTEKEKYEKEKIEFLKKFTKPKEENPESNPKRPLTDAASKDVKLEAPPPPAQSQNTRLLQQQVDLIERSYKGLEKMGVKPSQIRMFNGRYGSSDVSKFEEKLKGHLPDEEIQAFKRNYLNKYFSKGDNSIDSINFGMGIRTLSEYYDIGEEEIFSYSLQQTIDLIMGRHAKSKYPVLAHHWEAPMTYVALLFRHPFAIEMVHNIWVNKKKLIFFFILNLYIFYIYLKIIFAPKPVKTKSKKKGSFSFLFLPFIFPFILFFFFYYFNLKPSLEILFEYLYNKS